MKASDYGIYIESLVSFFLENAREAKRSSQEESGCGLPERTTTRLLRSTESYAECGGWLWIPA